jgi:hypothetical protein
MGPSQKKKKKGILFRFERPNAFRFERPNAFLKFLDYFLWVQTKQKFVGLLSFEPGIC